MRRLLLVILLALLALWGVACSILPGTGDETVAPTATATPPPPTPTAAPNVTPDLISQPAVSATQTTLTIWLPPEIVFATEEGTAVFEQQLSLYQANHPEIKLVVEPKAVTGQGSILSYLRTGRNVAAVVLPDLIAVPTAQLDTAMKEGLIVPLSGLIPTENLEDLYPAALELAIKEDTLRGYPFILTDLPQLAYNTAVFTRTVPTSWQSFVSLPNQTFAFPANGTPGTTLLLEMYLTAGGALTNEAGQPELQVGPLATALEQFANGRESGFILNQSSNITTLQESWRLLETGTATMAQTSAQQYLALRGEATTIGYSTFPNLGQSIPPLVNGWAWAISTTNSSKQTAVAELLNELIKSPNMGEWAYASNFLPARRSAFDIWPQDDDYVTFVQRQLSLAQPHPFTPNSDMMTVLGNALFDVVSLSKTPQTAAEEAAAALVE